jgi:hypothetical protein
VCWQVVVILISTKGASLRSDDTAADPEGGVALVSTLFSFSFRFSLFPTGDKTRKETRVPAPGRSLSFPNNV